MKWLLSIKESNSHAIWVNIFKLAYSQGRGGLIAVYVSLLDNLDEQLTSPTPTLTVSLTVKWPFFKTPLGEEISQKTKQLFCIKTRKEEEDFNIG